MNDIKKNNNTLKFLFFLLLLFTCFQNVSIVSFNSGFSFKMSHCISLLFIPFLIKNRKIKLPPSLLLLFLLYIIMLSIFLIPKYGFNSLLLNYVFGLYYLIIILTLGNKIDKDEWKSLFQKVAIIIMIATICKLILNINILIKFYSNPSAHPMINTFFGGGVNLEASWIAILRFFLYK